MGLHDQRKSQVKLPRLPEVPAPLAHSVKDKPAIVSSGAQRTVSKNGGFAEFTVSAA